MSTVLLSRRRLLVALLLCGICCGSVPAQDTPKPIPEPVTKTLTTRDGVPLRITYYASNKGKESPVVMLLHQKGGNRFVWQGDAGFAKTLQKEGYAVVTVDLRLHGESRPTQPPGGAAATVNLRPADYAAMWAIDVPAVKKFLVDEHHAEKLNVAKLGIVGAEISTAVAAYYTQYDWSLEPYEDNPEFSLRTPRGQDVKALVLISPDGKVPAMPLINIITRPLKDLNIAFYVCSGTKAAEKAEVTKLFGILQKAKDSEKRMFKDEFKAAYSGTDLLGKKLALEGKMLAFFNKSLKAAPGAWRSRKSAADNDPDATK